MVFTFVDIDDLIISVLGVWHFSQSTISMFDVRYQYALNDLYTFGTIDLIQYSTVQSYLALLQQMLSPEHAIRFNRKNKRLYLDMKWSRETRVGNTIVIEAYRIVDAKVYTDVYNDMMLKRYCSAIIKRQWATNLSKFQNIELPGGIKFNGSELFSQATQEIQEIEKNIIDAFQSPPEFIVG